MHVTSLRYQPVEGGALGGHFALHVSIGESNLPGLTFSATELSTRIHDAFEKLGLKVIRGVLIDCRSGTLLAEEMLSLLGVLRDWKYLIILWVGERVRYPWFELANNITAFVTSKNWPNFKVTEVRYIPPEVGAWEEPEVFEVNQGSWCYVMPRKRDTAEVLKFVTEARRAWGLILPSASVPGVAFDL